MLPQIVPSSTTAGFNVVFSSNEIDKYNQAITYVINGKHEFLFRVIAEVVPVTLNVDRKEIEFRFPEDSHEMFTSEILILSNNGNAAASFTWIIPNESFFTVDPMKGKVEAGK